MGHRFRRGGLALVVVLLLVFAACGRGADDTTTTEAVQETTTTTDTAVARADRGPRTRGPDDTRPTPQRGNRNTTTTTSEPDSLDTSTSSTTSTTVADASTTTTTVDPETFASSTTTTVGPSSGVGVGAPIGVIGCSNTHQAVDGYRDLSSLDLLTAGELGGGSINRWGNPNDSGYATYWGFFDQRRPASGYTGVWINVCLKGGQHDGTLSDTIKGWVEHTVEQVKVRDPDIPIWISGINFYTYACEATGALGPVVAAAAADWAAGALPGVSRGPDLGPLEESDTVRRDMCHLNANGQALIGSQLVVFFDGS